MNLKPFREFGTSAVLDAAGKFNPEVTKPPGNFGYLYKTRTYLVGSMQYADGSAWRVAATKILGARGIVSFDPYKKPFINWKDIDESSPAELQGMINDGKYDEMTAKMRMVRAYDLNLVDRSDFILAYINPKVPTVGSWEEIFWANRLKKPIFLVIEGGKKNTPFWVWGTLPHKYIYDSMEQALDMICDIDDGVVSIDSDRWRLLRYEYR